jgi:hypothetical protein
VNTVQEPIEPHEVLLNHEGYEALHTAHQEPLNDYNPIVITREEASAREEVANAIITAEEAVITAARIARRHAALMVIESIGRSAWSDFINEV